MADYLARIEVHHDHDYRALHQQLFTLGFVQAIRATDGTIHRLPTGTYFIQSEYGTRQVLTFAQNVLSSLGLTGEIVITQSAETWFAGLPRP